MTAEERARKALAPLRAFGSFYREADVQSSVAQAITEAVEQEREACAKVADDFGWILPVEATPEHNEITDDAVESVRSQIAAAIRSMDA